MLFAAPETPLNVGSQGLQGEKGDPGGVEHYVSASLTSYYTDVWPETDYHDVEGLLINFGSEVAWDVTIEFTWRLTGGGYYTDSAYISLLAGHEIYDFSERFYFEGGYDAFSWTITWT